MAATLEGIAHLSGWPALIGILVAFGYAAGKAAEAIKAWRGG